MEFKTFYESSSTTLLSVDIQPEYFYKQSKYGGFREDILIGLIEELNSDNYTRKIVLFNGPDLGMIKEDDYKMWLMENGLEEDRLNEILFYDKGYAWFRFCMDSGIDEDDIVDLVKFMKANNIYDSRQIKESELWDQFVKEYDRQELRELLEDADDCISIPALMDWLDNKIRGKIILMGGGRGECLKEVQIALKAMNKEYEENTALIYEKQEVMNNIRIYRALPNKVDPIFRKDDYVTKSEKFAREHAETSAIYNGEDYAVITTLVNKDDIIEADNPGEYKMTKDLPGRKIVISKLDRGTETVQHLRLK